MLKVDGLALLQDTQWAPRSGELSAPRIDARRRAAKRRGDREAIAPRRRASPLRSRGQHRTAPVGAHLEVGRGGQNRHRAHRIHAVSPRSMAARRPGRAGAESNSRRAQAPARDERVHERRARLAEPRRRRRRRAGAVAKCSRSVEASPSPAPRRRVHAACGSGSREQEQSAMSSIPTGGEAADLHALRRSAAQRRRPRRPAAAAPRRRLLHRDARVHSPSPPHGRKYAAHPPSRPQLQRLASRRSRAVAAPLSNLATDPAAASAARPVRRAAGGRRDRGASRPGLPPRASLGALAPARPPPARAAAPNRHRLPRALLRDRRARARRGGGEGVPRVDGLHPRQRARAAARGAAQGAREARAPPRNAARPHDAGGRARRRARARAAARRGSGRGDAALARARADEPFLWLGWDYLLKCLVDTNAPLPSASDPLLLSWFLRAGFVPVLECGAPEVAAAAAERRRRQLAEGIMLVEFATAEELEGEWWFDPARLHTADERMSEGCARRRACCSAPPEPPASTSPPTRPCSAGRATTWAARWRCCSTASPAASTARSRRTRSRRIARCCCSAWHDATPSTPASSSGGRSASSAPPHSSKRATAGGSSSGSTRPRTSSRSSRCTPTATRRRSRSRSGTLAAEAEGYGSASSGSRCSSGG